MSNNRVVIPPVNCLFNYLQQQATLSIWLYEQVGYRIQGKICGFDEFMNVVIEDAIQVPVDPKTGGESLEQGVKLGRILLKGDNITLMTTVD